MTSTAVARTALVDITRQGLTVPALFDAATQILQPAVGCWAYCWETLDPVTLLPTSGVTHNLPPGSAPAYFENEYGHEDFNKFEDLLASGVAARTLFDATAGEPQRSRRYRELFVPNGLGPELRAVLADGQECWGAVSFLREATADEFAPEVTPLLAQVAVHLARAIRTALLLSAGVRGADNAPGVVVVDKAGSIVSTTTAADRWLDLLEDHRHTAGRDQLPVAVEAVLAQLARGTDAASPRARVTASDGTWLVVHAVELDRGACRTEMASNATAASWLRSWGSISSSKASRVRACRNRNAGTTVDESDASGVSTRSASDARRSVDESVSSSRPW